MKVSLRVSQFLRSLLKRRGLIAEISAYTGIERHTVAGLINNTVKYISLDALAKISAFLVYRGLADPRILPGALIGRDPERFYEMLADCGCLDYVVGARVSEEWPGADYVMSTDSRLQGVLVSRIAGFRSEWPGGAAESGGPPTADGVDVPAGQGSPAAAPRPFVPAFHMVPAPVRKVSATSPGPEWPDVRAAAESLYARLTYDDPAAEPSAEAAERAAQASALIALGSVKVNPVVELMFARVFGAEPFVSQDGVPRPSSRSCPVLFRYREADPQPPSCCGGLALAEGVDAPETGLYYETADKTWACCPCDPTTSDVGFIFYTYQPNIAHVELACGGFSSRATHCLTEHLDQIVLEVDEPQYVSPALNVGLYLIRFTFDAEDEEFGPFRDNRKFKHQVIPVPAKAISRRLKKKS